MMNKMTREQAQSEVDSFNRTYSVGDTVRYVKSEIEGLVPLTIIKEAYVFGDNLPAVDLDGIGLVLLAKVEPCFDASLGDVVEPVSIGDYEFSKGAKRAYLIVAFLFISIQALSLFDVGLPEWARMAVTIPYIFFVGIQLAPDIRIWVRKNNNFSKSNDKRA